MCAKRISVKTALPAVVASMTLLSVLTSAQTTIAYQGMRGLGTGETCTFTKQLDDVTFRQRYLQKVAALQNGVAAPNLASVEEMYSNVRKVSLFDDDPGAEDAASATVGVDQLSIDCLGCHDGSGASNVTINLRNDPFRTSGRGVSSGKADHPIGMDYARYASARMEDFKPLFGKNKMVLVNGKVGCLTCHDPLNKEQGHLVMSDRGSALCLTCHGK